jgi:glycosyltransferase involved in cell wall biosynthesis
MTTELTASTQAPAEPFFSIVMPTWNRGAIVRETIHSLLNQDFPDSQYEVIIVDDGSTDNTLECLDEFSNRVRIYRQANSGAPAARNLGIRKAKGSYIVCFDHDDILLPSALGVYRTVIDAFAQPPVVIAQQMWFRDSQAINVPISESSGIQCVKCRDFFSKRITLGTTNSLLVLRRNVVLDAGGYSCPSGGLDDDILLFKLGIASPMVKILQPITVAHRIHDQNASKSLAYLTQGLGILIQNERRGIYPGGWKRMVDRRGLIGTTVLSAVYFRYIKPRGVPFAERIKYTAGVLMSAREMLIAGLLRKACCSVCYHDDSAIRLKG